MAARIYIRQDGSIAEPKDLEGKRVGCPEWAQTAQIFARGFLSHEYNVDLRKIEWVQASVNDPGRTEKVNLRLPDGLQLTPAPTKSLNEMLLSGEIDAAMSAHPPTCFKQGHPNIGRLFEDYVPIEQKYYEKTGIFPLMHVVAIRSDIVRDHPWAPNSLYTAFVEARRRSIERALFIDASRFPIPWGYDVAARGQKLFGELWPYGIEANRVTLEAGLQYAFEQGVSHRKLTPEDLFAKQIQTRYRT